MQVLHTILLFREYVVASFDVTKHTKTLFSHHCVSLRLVGNGDTFIFLQHWLERYEFHSVLVLINLCKIVVSQATVGSRQPNPVVRTINQLFFSFISIHINKLRFLQNGTSIIK